MPKSHQEKLTILKELIDLSKVDDKVTINEENFIKNIADKLGISEKELKELENKDIEYVHATQEFDRIEQLYRLILLMVIDGEFRDDEVIFVREVGLRLGLMPLATDELLRRTIMAKDHMLEPDEIIEIFRTYYN